MATEKHGLSLSDFEAEIFELSGAAENLNIMVHGDSGAGKTVLAGTSPGRLFFLAGEPGYISAARQGAKGQGRIIRDTASGDAALRWLEAGNFAKYDWVIADGLHTMQKKFLLGYAAEAFDQNPAKRQHRNLPDKPDYFNAQNFVIQFVSRLVDLPVNVLYTTHSMRMDNDEGDLVVFPAIQGKGYEVSNFVSGLMHCVGYMAPRVVKRGNEVEHVRRILWRYTQDPKTETSYFAKDQLDALGWYTDDATMPDLLAMIADRNAQISSPKETTKAIKAAKKKERQG